MTQIYETYIIEHVRILKIVIVSSLLITYFYSHSSHAALLSVSHLGALSLY